MTLVLGGPARPSAPRARAGRWGWVVAGLVLTLILGIRTLTASTPAELVDATAFPSSPAIEARYGVRFAQVDVLAAGGLLELRYVVLDPALAAALHDRGEAHLPRVIAPSGAELRETPFHSHATEQTAGASYSILYRNDGGAVAPGDRIDITVGDLRLTDVAVR